MNINSPAEDKIIVELTEQDMLGLEITYEENEFINVGEYTTTANIILYKPEYYVIINSPNLTYNWKIEVAQNEFIEEVTIANWEYGQNASIPTGESKFGEVYFLYSDSIDGDYKSTMPTIPGQYYLKGCVDGSSNYMGICSDVIEFEILKKDALDNHIPILMDETLKVIIEYLKKENIVNVYLKDNENYQK